MNGGKRESGNGFMIIKSSKEKCFSGDKEPKARTVHDIKAKLSSPLVRTETNHSVQKYKTLAQKDVNKFIIDMIIIYVNKFIINIIIIHGMI